MVIALAAGGLVLQGIGDLLAQRGNQAPAVPMFFAGLVAIFLPCAWRLTATSASRSERVAVSLVLGIALVASYYIRSPSIFDWFDELIHGATLNSLLRGRSLDVHNSLLPISSYYPGLELLTVAVKWVTGLPVVLAQLVVIVAARTVVVLGVFLVVERLCGSAHAGGVGVLVYAANPSFYTFASWDYGPVALAFAIATVYFVLSSLGARTRGGVGDDRRDLMPSPPPGRHRFVPLPRYFLLALASMAALVVTHHLTPWLTASLLVLWAGGLWVDGRRRDARVVGLSAAALVAMASGWTAFVGSHLTSYLGPIFRDASDGFQSALGHFHNSRPLFHTYSQQGGSSNWEIACMLVAAASLCLLLCPSVLAVLTNRTALRGRRRLLPVVVAAAYPLAMLASISSGSSQVGERTTTFIFFGMAIVLAAWLVLRLPKRRTLLERAATVLIATVCFVGSMVFGSGPDITYVRGPYLVGANQRSISAPVLEAARWASTHLAAGSVIAADRQSGAVIADFADVHLATGIGGYVDPSPLFFSDTFTGYDLRLILRDDIRYIVVDRDLSSSLPLFGTYFEPGESAPGTRLTSAELGKFGTVPGLRSIYDNGQLVVYQVPLPRALPPPGTSAPTGTNPVVLAGAAAVAMVWIIRIRRRRGHPPVSERVVLRWLVGGMVAGIALAAATIPSRFSPTVIGLGGLAIVLAIVLAATRSRPVVPEASGRARPGGSPAEPAARAPDKWSE